jgi:ABC-type dipeptide/oligopeptide/nickel transport system permease subunit
VPFRGLSYDPASTEWGLDIVRQIRATSETIRWAATPPGTRMVDLTYAGTAPGCRA